MAVAPLFVANIATLKSELRLSGLKSGSDGEQIFERGVTSARIALYSRLGLTVTNAMLAQADVDNPSTLIQLQRKSASLAEVELVRMQLLQTMPVIVADASGDAQQLYNDEGVWRDISPDELKELLERMEGVIDDLLAVVLEEEDLGVELGVRVFDGSRASDADVVRYPGGTLWPTIDKFQGNFTHSFIFGSSDAPIRFLLQIPD